MTKELKQQYTLRITRAGRAELIVILYDMMLTYIEEAIQAHSEENYRDFREALRKTSSCNQELIAALNFEYAISMNLLSLYLYVNRELAAAGAKNSSENLRNAAKVIRGLKEGYEVLAEQDQSGPIMENTQTVYAGLTYGKNDLTENMSDQGTNRGFLA